MKCIICGATVEMRNVCVHCEEDLNKTYEYEQECSDREDFGCR